MKSRIAAFRNRRFQIAMFLPVKQQKQEGAQTFRNNRCEFWGRDSNRSVSAFSKLQRFRDAVHRKAPFLCRGTAGTENRNRSNRSKPQTGTEPNRGHPANCLYFRHTLCNLHKLRGPSDTFHIARYVAKWGIARMCLCETKYQEGLGIAPFWESANHS